MDAQEAKKQWDDSPRPWTVDKERGQIWANDGDSIISQLPDGTPYIEPETAELIVQSVNSSAQVEAQLVRREKTIKALIAESQEARDGRRVAEAELVKLRCHLAWIKGRTMGGNRLGQRRWALRDIQKRACKALGETGPEEK
jgi:hypothetical protein